MCPVTHVSMPQPKTNKCSLILKLREILATPEGIYYVQTLKNWPFNYHAIVVWERLEMTPSWWKPRIVALSLTP